MIISKANKINGLNIFKESIIKNIPVIFPTDTIYGIGAPLSAINANKEIFRIKNRQENKPFPILAGNINQVSKIANLNNLTTEAENYIKKWPAPITLILKSNDNLHPLYSSNNTVAVRIPDLQWLRDVLIEINEPITATSVNISNNNFAKDFREAVNIFNNKIKLYLWQHNLLNTSSEIYDLTNKDIKKIR